MFIMHDKAVELGLSRRRLFQSRRRPLPEPEPEEESDDDSSEFSEDNFLNYDSIFEYFAEKGFDMDVGWSILVRNLVKSAKEVSLETFCLTTP